MVLAGKAAEAAKRASTPSMGAGPPALLGVGVGSSCLLILVHSASGSKNVSVTAAKVQVTAVAGGSTAVWGRGGGARYRAFTAALVDFGGGDWG